MAGSQFQPGKLERSGKALAEYPRADIQVERIAYLAMLDRAAFTPNRILEFGHETTETLHNAGQSLWLDNITRDLLTSGWVRLIVLPERNIMNPADTAAAEIRLHSEFP